jgi:SAM-dependent methyltransferase
MARSVVYDHLLAILNTECHRFEAGAVVRILDAGCGKGFLMRWLREQLPEAHPGLRFEVYGFDVVDYGEPRDAADLGEGVCWISVSDPWPYPDHFFQAVISNHVLEHVDNKDLFFSELDRTLCEGGFSAHLFPLRHYIWEGHIHIPFAHRIRNRDALVSYIRTMSRLGFGRFREHSAGLGLTLQAFAEQQADFILFFTRYMGYPEALALAQKHHLRGSFRYTRELYTRKLRSLASLAPCPEYERRRSALWDWLSVLALRYVSGVTLFLEKTNSYHHGTEERVAAAMASCVTGELGS